MLNLSKLLEGSWGQFSGNPSKKELQESDLDLVIAGTSDGVIMVESQASELSEDIIADALPSDISNGMVVTTEDPTDKTRFLIQGFQKRIFRNLGEFYARGFTLGKLKSLSQEELDSIPDGDPIE